jgi:hypothetical protein
LRRFEYEVGFTDAFEKVRGPFVSDFLQLVRARLAR